MRLPFILTLSKNYWKIRNSIYKLRFKQRKNSYKLSALYVEEKERKASTLLQIQNIAWSIIRALVAIIFLYSIEHLSNLLWKSYEASVPSWLSTVQRLLPKPTYPDDADSIIQLVSIIASVSGVILALFYPVLATIASTAYSKVHSSIRILLLKEKETQGYLRRLTYLTAISLVILLLIGFRLYPGTLVISFLVFYALLALFGILNIGLGIYRYFEPSSLISIVVSTLKNIINNVTIKGVYWHDNTFQDYYYKLGIEQCENLSLINDLIIAEKEIKNSSYKTSIFQSFSLLEYYLNKKREIPLDSYWFPRIYSHTSYFESDMMTRGLSHNTKAYVLPKQTQHNDWFEEVFIQNLSKSIGTLISRGQINLISITFGLSYSVIDLLSKTYNTVISQKLFDEYKRNIIVIGKKPATKREYPSYEVWKHELGCIQSYVIAIQMFQLGVLQKIINTNSNKIKYEFQKIRWGKTDSIYKTDFIPELIEQVNIFNHNILNEISIEGKRITPDWYIIQVLASIYLQKTNKCLENTADYFGTYITSIAESFNEEKNALLSCFTAHLGLEVLFKLQTLMPKVSQVFEDIDTLQKVTEETIWIKPDVARISEKLEACEKNCLSIVSSNLVNLSKLNWDNKYPDAFAQSYSIIISELNKCFYNDDILHFQEYFPSFLESSLTSFHHLNETFKKHTQPYNISSQVIIDSLQISGYAYLYSHIYNKNEYWDLVKSTWDNYFIPDPENIRFLLMVYHYSRRIQMSTPLNFTEEHQRHLTFMEVVKSKNLHRQDINDLWVQHFINDSMIPSIHTDELFIELYLFTFISAKPFISLIERDLLNIITNNIGRQHNSFHDYF